MMQTAKHTPGPWHVLSDLTIRTREWSHCQQMGDADGCIIADLGPALGVCDPSSDGIALSRKVRAHAVPETDANAHLIAAAPDLLIACQEAIRSLDLANDDPTNRTYPLYVLLRNAIAKATGQ